MEFRESPTAQRAKQNQSETETVEASTVAATKPRPSKAKAKSGKKAKKPQAKARQNTTASKAVREATAPARPRRRSRGSERAIYYLTGLVELLLLLRLLLSGAQSSAFGRAIYNLANPLARPINDLFTANLGHTPNNGVIFLTMIVYGLIGWGIGRLLRPRR